jgi:hypothetical protein
MHNTNKDRSLKPQTLRLLTLKRFRFPVYYKLNFNRASKAEPSYAGGDDEITIIKEM